MRCVQCRGPANDADDYCPRCGMVIREEITCSRHAVWLADGVCIICGSPSCASCGGWLGGLFLCNEHHGYEVIEGMARVFGGSDSIQVEYAKSCLEQHGMHPFFFTRKASPLSLGGPDYSLFRASGDYGGHIINEFKLMVPCPEVLRAEEVLKSLDLAGTEGTERS